MMTISAVWDSVLQKVLQLIQSLATWMGTESQSKNLKACKSETKL